VFLLKHITHLLVCQSCCIDVDEDYTDSDHVTGSRDDVTDSVWQWKSLDVRTTCHLLIYARYSAIWRLRLANVTHHAFVLSMFFFRHSVNCLKCTNWPIVRVCMVVYV